MSMTREIHGLVLTDHEFSVPLDHARLGDERIGIFAREVAADNGRERPFLVFFPGGPGRESPRPTTSSKPTWLPRALKDYRVLLLDHRGTGRSTPLAQSEHIRRSVASASVVGPLNPSAPAPSRRRGSSSTCGRSRRCRRRCVRAWRRRPRTGA